MVGRISNPSGLSGRISNPSGLSGRISNPSGLSGRIGNPSYEKEGSKNARPNPFPASDSFHQVTIGSVPSIV
jgi:hypothetical protein